MSGARGAGSRRAQGGPDGLPLGRAFLIGPGLAHEPLREAIDVIARVHGDGELPTIPVVWDTYLDARARFVIRNDQPSAIAVAPGPKPTIPIIHEIGHFLDFAAIDSVGGFASLHSSGLARWSTLVQQTPTARDLAEVVARVLAWVDPVDPMYRLLATLPSLEELWARCYTQYIVLRSARADLRTDLESERAVSLDQFVFPLHWDEREFAPVSDEIERLFRSLGWRRN